MDSSKSEMNDESKTLAEDLQAAFEESVKTDEPEIQAETVEEAAAEVQTSEETQEEEIVPPEHWSDEDKTVYLAMTPEQRDWAQKFEGTFQKGIQEKSEELKKYRDAIEPYRYLIPPGVDETAMIHQLMNAQAVLTKNPTEGINWLKSHYGIKDSTDTSEEIPEFETPEEKQIRELRNEVNSLKQNRETDVQNAERDRQQQMFAEIAQFRDAVDEDGKTKHPHFDAVYPVMGGLLQSGRAKDLDDAYTQAVWAIPEYRDSVIEEKSKEAVTKELEEKAKTVETAKKKAKTVKGKSSAKETKKEKTRRDQLRENYEKSVRGEL